VILNCTIGVVLIVNRAQVLWCMYVCLYFVSVQCWAGAEMSVAELRTEWIETKSCCRTPASVTCWRHVTSSTWTAADTATVDISYRWTGECTNDCWYKDRQQLVHSVHVSIHLLYVLSLYTTVIKITSVLVLMRLCVAVHLRIVYKIATLVYSVLHCHCPQYLLELITFDYGASGRRCLRSTTSHAAIVHGQLGHRAPLSLWPHHLE